MLERTYLLFVAEMGWLVYMGLKVKSCSVDTAVSACELECLSTFSLELQR